VPYLSEIQHRRVIEPNGNEVGKLADIAVVPQGQFPAAQWAILSTPSGEKVVRWGDLTQEIGHFRLRNRLETTPDAQLPAEALRLARDLLDKQIVDTHGAKVVRVNDLQLSDVDGQLRLVGADVAQVGRAIGSEDDQRCPGMKSLDHRRVKFGCCGARGAQEHHGLSGPLGQADPKKGAGSLVDVDEHADLGMALKRDGEWRRPRAG
jgi:sporulation protein YlmC with PRC-barrel domain